MNKSFEVSRPRINGSQLPQFQGKAVCLLGEVLQTEPSGRAFKLKTSDNQTVMVQMQEPVQDLLEGIIEIQGMVTPKNTIQCQYYVVFPKESVENFDMALYNDAVQIMAQYPDHYVIKTS